MKFNIFFVLAMTVLWLCPYAQSQTPQDSPIAACESLSRPNIDCQCVAKRASAMSDYAGSASAAAALLESYKFALGDDNADMTALSTLDPLMVAKADIRLESFGGWPDDINEFEKSCVIPDADPIDITAPEPDTAASEYIRNCTASSDSERLCQCRATRVQNRLSPEQFAANTRGHSNFLGKPTSLPEQDNEQTLIGESAAILEKTDGADYLHCHALTYADDMAGNSPEERKQGYAPAPATNALPETAEELIRQNCVAGDESQSYCTCYLTAYKSRIIDRAAPRAAMTVALITDSGNMDEAWVMERMSQITKDDQAAMQSLMITAMGIGNSCE